MKENVLWEDLNKSSLDPKLKKEIDDIDQTIRAITIDFHNYEFPKYIWNYKKYLWFVADRVASIDPWQSNVDYPLVASVVDTMFGNIFDFWYEFWINESKLKRLCTEAFDFRWTGKTVFKEVTKEILITWKGYVKDLLIKENHTEKIFNRDLISNIKTPSLQYISIFDVMYDRTKWLTNSPFKILRTFATWDAIKAKVLPLILEQYEESEHKTATKKFDSMIKKYKDDFWHRFSMYDYNPVKSLTATTQFMNSKSWYVYTLPLCENNTDMVAWIAWDWWNINDESKNNYFLNEKKSTYELVEYTTNNRKAIFLNWNIIYIWDKHRNIWEIREANFSLVPWTWNANWVADNLGWLQDINNSLWNAFMDNIKLVMWPMFKISGNIPMWKNGTLDFKKFRAFRTNGSSNIEKISLWVTDFAPINFMQIVQAFAEQRSWVNNYIMWGQWTIERVSWGIDMKFNQYKSKLTPITDSIDQMMWHIARSWILMYFKFFSKEELTKMWITIEEIFIEWEWKKNTFDTFTINWIDIKTILDEKNITFTFNSLNKLTKENSRASIKEVLPAMLQYAWESLNMPEIVKLLAWQDFNPEKVILSDSEIKTRKQFSSQTEWWWFIPNSWETDNSQSWWYKSQYDLESKWTEPYASQQPTYQDYSDDQLISKAQSIS